MRLNILHLCYFQDNLKISAVFSLGGASSSNGPAAKDNPRVLKNSVRKRQRGEQEKEEVKDEPVNEEYDKALAPANALPQHVKDEPEDEDNLKISAVFSLGGASSPNVTSASPVLTTTQAQAQGQLSSDPPSVPASKCVTCSGCMKILTKGQMAYQKKGSSQLFCSKCVTLYSSAPSKVVTPLDKRTCYSCLKEIMEPKHLIKAPVDVKRTIKDFCSQTCLSSFNFIRNTVDSPLSGVENISSNDWRGFRDLLKMDVEDFNVLLGKVEPHMRKRVSKLTTRERLSIALRFLVTGESFRSLCFRYWIGRNYVSEIVMETCEALHDVLKEDYLKTPTTVAEWREVARGFQEKWQFPHCLGAMGGKHINCIYKPKISVTLVAVVDANCKFIYAKFCTQGSMSDAGLFGQSDLRAAMNRDLLNVPRPEPLPDTNIIVPYAFIGSEAFPHWTDLVKPYPPQTLDHGQRIFNYRLSRARRTAENAFGILASRLRVFRTGIALQPEKATMIILAALSVHNFLTEQASEAYLPPAFVDMEDENHRIIRGAWRRDGELAPVVVIGAKTGTAMAKEQRDQLKTHFLSPAGSLPWQDNMI